MAEPAASSIGPAETPRTHCWECLRRRLVCDSARPVCNRCRTAGLVCPGYDEKQPLRWVKPGRVSARSRGRRREKAVGVPSRRTLDSGHVEGDGEVIKTNIADRRRHSPSGDEEGSRGEIEDVLYFLGVRPPRALDVIMRYDIACENFAGVKASYIYNCEIYERTSPLNLLLEESRLRLPLAEIAHAQLLPVPVQSLFILFALGYQIQKLPADVDENVRARARVAVSFWTYQVVRALNEDIAREETRSSDGTMTGVLMLMMACQQLQPSSDWRYHYRGLMQMVRLRGGIEKVWHESPHMQTGILGMIIGEVFANTTSPSDDMVMELSHPKNMDFLRSAWGGSCDVTSLYIGSICPPSLFVSVIQINHLRALAQRGLSPASPPASHSSTPDTSSLSSPEEDISIYTDPQTLLSQILQFSPETYASANSNARTYANWHLVGRIHQSATALYCILSLQSALLLPNPPTATLQQTVHTHYERLLLDLKEGHKQSNFKNCFFWPLVVAGVAAVRGTAFERAFVADTLRENVAHMGCAMPILARRVLEAFWSSGKTGWDECFDQPYIFLL
ncbi:fungal-specific transcription factor domain-containing protein [Xylaria venustula]|nr:fungal-specific transcription factor domain-containing protein [Xylaria venustula]